MPEPIINRSNDKPSCWVVMGVSGSGKSEIACRLAERLGARLIEGDQFHSAASIEKMRAGRPLNDADRQEWLLVLQSQVSGARTRGERIVLACSALKRRYRDLLRSGNPDLIFVHLHGDRDLLAARMVRRTGHYMPSSLLDSQFRDLEPLQPDENGACFDVANAPGVLVEQIVGRLC